MRITSFVSLSIVFVSCLGCAGALDACIMKEGSYCECQYNNGSTINLERIAKKNTFAFPYQNSEDPLSSFQYAYNPCFPVTDTANCENVAACQRDPNSMTYYSIGDAYSATFAATEDVQILGYTSTDQQGNHKVLTVKLVCDPAAKTPKLQIAKEITPNVYTFTLTSECCCPDLCPGISDGGGLSFGSILCITFSCLLFVYLAVGMLYMGGVKKETGKDMVPNYSFWSSLPGLIKDGCTFTFTKIKSVCSGGDGSKFDEI